MWIDNIGNLESIKILNKNKGQHWILAFWMVILNKIHVGLKVKINPNCSMKIQAMTNYSINPQLKRQNSLKINMNF